MPHKPLPLATVVNIVESVFFQPESKVTKSNEKITPTNKPKHMPKKQTANILKSFFNVENIKLLIFSIISHINRLFNLFRLYFTT